MKFFEISFPSSWILKQILRSPGWCLFGPGSSCQHRISCTFLGRCRAELFWACFSCKTQDFTRTKGGFHWQMLRFQGKHVHVTSNHEDSSCTFFWLAITTSPPSNTKMRPNTQQQLAVDKNRSILIPDKKVRKFFFDLIIDTLNERKANTIESPTLRASAGFVHSSSPALVPFRW